MSENDYNSAYEGGIGADRMANGLSCIPHPIKGDLHWILKYKTALESLTKERDELKKQVEELEKNYYELIMAVARKWPNETRHQTALKYINQAENNTQGPDSECKSTMEET